VESITEAFTNAEITRAASICNKSAIMDHYATKNYAKDWENVKVIDRQSDKIGRVMREAV